MIGLKRAMRSGIALQRSMRIVQKISGTSYIQPRYVVAPSKFNFSAKIGSASMIEMEELEDWDRYL